MSQADTVASGAGTTIVPPLLAAAGGGGGHGSTATGGGAGNLAVGGMGGIGGGVGMGIAVSGLPKFLTTQNAGKFSIQAVQPKSGKCAPAIIREPRSPCDEPTYGVPPSAGLPPLEGGLLDRTWSSGDLNLCAR